MSGTQYVTYGLGSQPFGNVPAFALDQNFADATNYPGTSPSGGQIVRSLLNKAADITSVKDFGVMGNGLNDDTSNLQAAINWFPGNLGVVGNGGILFFPQGTYILSNNLSVQRDNLTFWGTGRGSIIQTSHTTADVFTLGDGVGTFAALQFIDLRIESSVTKSAGFCFNVKRVTNFKAYRVWCGTLDSYVNNGNVARLYNGYYFDHFGQTVVDDGEITCSNIGIQARGHSDQTFGAELTIGGGLRIVYALTKGIWLGGACGGVHMNRIDVSFCGYGLYIDDTLQTGIANREIFMNPGCTIDSNTNWGINMESNACSLFQMTGAWVAGNGISANGTGGMRVAPTTGANPEMHIIGAKFYNNQYDNLQLSCGNLTLSGSIVRNAGAGNAQGGHGLLIAGVAVTPAQVIGNYFHNNGNATRGRDISITSGAQDNFLIAGNVFQTWGEIATNPAINNTTTPGSTRVIRDNIGYVTENSGTTSIANGTNTIAVNHGLAKTPDSVTAWFASNPIASQQLFIAPSSFTATQFTITSTQLAGVGGQACGWRAVLGSE